MTRWQVSLLPEVGSGEKEGDGPRSLGCPE